MRLRLSPRLLLVLLVVGLALTLISSYWTHCAPDAFASATQSRVERWRHLQSSVRLDSTGKRRTSLGQTIDGGKRFSDSPEDLGDLDSADFADGSLPAPGIPVLDHGGFYGDQEDTGRVHQDEAEALPPPRPSPRFPRDNAEVIDCLVNDDYTVPCRKEGREVYLPFYKFIRKYFEVYGKVSKSEDGVERFEWQHSYSRVFFPKKKYDPAGSFLWFENYNVEVRDRVMCISASEGVPVSTQWNPSGHIYPIQVAQFGLSHFSKNLTESRPPVIHVLEDGYQVRKARWSDNQDETAQGKSEPVFKRTDRTIEFSTPVGTDDTVGATLNLLEGLVETSLSLDILFTSNGSINALLVESTKGTLYTVSYVTSNVRIGVTNKGTIVYGLGDQSIKNWRHLTRDLKIDLQKGLALIQSKKKAAKLKSVRLKSLTFRGEGYVTNITMGASDHMAHFYAASDYLVKHQDDKGGWPIMVTRKLSNGMLELKPGWYSAMAQGQAMSLLTRAFRVTGQMKYLESALAATKVFNIRAENHGVLTSFLGKFVWYEEYPTVPSSFVLNGFIYSLIGLYDLKASCKNVACRDASKLFDEGMTSLKKMLTLFDTGSGTVYDLRHFSLGVAPNLARWDYHTTHINQLLLLSTIDSDPILKITAQRWMGYMKGKRAPHN